MVWTVLYRDKDGKRTSIEMEAADRDAVFAELKRQGITAISVSIGKSGWAQKTKPNNRMIVRPARLVVAGLIAAASATVTWLWLSSDKNAPIPPSRPVDKKPTLISTVTHVTMPRNERTDIEPPKQPEKPKRFWQQPTTNGLTEAQQRIWKVKNRPPPGITNNTALTEAKPKYAIFNHNSENTIAAYLTINPGQTLVGSPIYDRKFTEDFLKSLQEPIIVTKDDDPETAALKRAMIETKIELKTRYDDGEDIGKILEQTHEELRQLSQYKQQIEGILKETIYSGELSEADFDLAIDAANKMLDDKGIAPMEFGPVSRRILLRHVRPNN